MALCSAIAPSRLKRLVFSSCELWNLDIIRHMSVEHSTRLEREREFYKRDRIRKHPLNHPLLYTPERTLGNFILAKEGFEAFLGKRLNGLQPHRILLAPSGGFGDMSFVRHLWPDARAFGADISIDVIRSIPHDDCPTVAADVRGGLPFADKAFDLVIASLFFHHTADEGWEPYIRELHRTIRSGGVLMTMEPSWMHPLFWITRPLRHVFGNITGQVDHEHPIFVWSLEKQMRACGFRKTDAVACSFSHHRVPLAVSRALNRTLSRLSTVRPFLYLGWQVGVIAWK
jgi:SAM-dependent methyltransferase